MEFEINCEQCMNDWIRMETFWICFSCILYSFIAIIVFFGNSGLFEKAELFLWTFIPGRAKSIHLQSMFSFYLTCFGSNLTLRGRLFFFYCSSTNLTLRKWLVCAWTRAYLSMDVCLCYYSVQYIRLRVRICCYIEEFSLNKLIVL